MVRGVLKPLLERHAHRPADRDDLPEARLLDPPRLEVADPLVGDVAAGRPLQALAAPSRSVVAPVLFQQTPEDPAPIALSWMRLHRAGLNMLDPPFVKFLTHEYIMLVYEKLGTKCGLMGGRWVRIVRHEGSEGLRRLYLPTAYILAVVIGVLPYSGAGPVKSPPAVVSPCFVPRVTEP